LSCLDGPLDEAHLHRAVVQAAKEEQQGNQKCAHIDHVHSTFLLSDRQCTNCNSDSNPKHNQTEDEKDDKPGSGELRAHTGHLSAVRAPRQGVVQCVEQEGVVTMRASDSAHAWNVWDRRVSRRAGSQVDDPLTVWARAGDALRAAFADEETVARATHVLTTRGGVADRSRLIARGALHNVLILFTRYIDHVLADPT